MNLKEDYKHSFLRKVLIFLFADNLSIKFTNTRIGKLLSSLTREIRLASYNLILASIFLLWYERPLELIWPPLGYDFLPFLLLLTSFFLIPKAKLVIHKYHLWYLGFLAASLVAGIVGAIKGYGGIEIFWGFAVFVQLGLVIVLGNLLGRNKIELHLSLISIPLFIYGAWEAISGEGAARYSALETAGLRIGSLLENPNIFGFILVILAISIWKIADEMKNKYYYVLVLPILPLLYLTGSRTAWIALVLSAITIALSRHWRYILAAPLLLFALFVPRIRERILVVLTRDYIIDASIDGRIWSLRNALHIWRQNFMGTGPGTYGGRIAEAHASPVYLQSMQNGYTALYTTDNQLLAILVQAGMLGLISFGAFWVSLLARLVSGRKVFGVALVVAFLVMMTFSNALEFGAVVLPIGLIIGRELAMTSNQQNQLHQ